MKNSFPDDKWVRNPRTVLCRQFGPTSFYSNGLQKRIVLRDTFCKIGIWDLIGANMNVWFAERRKIKDNWDSVNEWAENKGTW
jgi:hypothetical protein